MTLFNAIEAFKEEKIAIRTGRCLNPRHRIEFCDACSTACPQDAITLTVDDVNIEPMDCNNCGLCLSACPTGVFEHDDFQAMAWLSAMKGKRDLKLRCMAVPPDDAEQTTTRIPCHGMLDARLLAALTTVGVERIQVMGADGCDQCPSKVGYERLQVGLAEAKALGVIVPQVTVDAPDLAVAEDEHAQIEASETDRFEQRRAFFTHLGGKGATMLSKAMPSDLLEAQEEAALSFDSTDEAQLMVKHVPPLHQAALTSFFSQNRPIADGEVSWLHRIESTDACTGCQTCAIRCPTGALEWKDSGQQVQLMYRSAVCIGCSLCVSVCPYDALSLHHHREADIDDDVRALLFESKQLTCETCGDTFLPHDGDNRFCWICKNEQEMDHEWMSLLAKANGEERDA